MAAYPLLDLQSAWHDAQALLREVMDRAEALYEESEHTWYDVLMVRARALHALSKLGDLPAGILDGITAEQADLDELGAQAEARSS